MFDALKFLLTRLRFLTKLKKGVPLWTFSQTNSLAYYDRKQKTKKKVFVKITSGLSVTKLFPLVIEGSKN